MSRNAKWNKEMKDSGKMRQNNAKKMTKRNSSKNQRRDKEIADTAIRSEENDYGWHSKFPNFSRDAGTLPFSNPLGNSLHLNQDLVSTPGVMALRFIPTIGYSANQRSAINRSASRFKTYLRSVMKASADYDAADIMIILMAVDSLYMFHQYLCRAYRAANLWSPLNKYYPDALLTAMGINPSIRQDLARFRGYINQLAINLTRFAIPANFDINYRHQWMCEGLYLDSPTTRAQTYLFVPEGFWKYANTAETGSQLTWLQNKNQQNAHTLDTLIELGTQMLDALSNDDDVDIIMGDLYIAYGKAGMKQLSELGELETVIPVYDQVVLSQIENATVTGGFAPGYTPVISQDPSVNGNGLLFTPRFAGNIQNIVMNGNTAYYPNPAFCHGGALLNMHIDSPSPEAVMEATRLVVAIENDTPAPSTVNGFFEPTIFGSDVVSTLNIAYYNGVNSLVFYVISSQAVPRDPQQTPEGVVVATPVSMWATTEVFDWAPMLYATLVSSTQTNVAWILADIDNAAWVPSWQINMLHEASLLSLFDVPDFPGKQQLS